MANQFPVIRVYPPCKGHNGVIYALATLGREDLAGAFEINIFLNNSEVKGKKEYGKYWSALRSLNTRSDVEGRLGFFINLKYEFCEFGHAFPPDSEIIKHEAPHLVDLIGTKLRTYLLHWERDNRTLILLRGLIKDIPPDSDDFSWQTHFSDKISPLIDIYYAIKDGLAEHDFYYFPGRPGFYDKHGYLKEEIELTRYIPHGRRLTCDRDDTGGGGVLPNSTPRSGLGLLPAV